ncbi:cytoplasmic protein [Pannonibacter sp.]|uniref:cytoplasmic protein n=1 Tax=Pannonibacter sp. TaxID=1906786 RepID=UPI003F711FDF
MFSTLRMSHLCFVACLLATASGLALPVQAQEQVYFSSTAEPRLPACDSPAVQSAVAGRVASADALYYGGRTITVIDRIAETAYKANGISPLARRFCTGIATLSDGSRHTVHYALVQHGGFVGLSWGVDACLNGLDRWYVHDASCRTVRP